MPRHHAVNAATDIPRLDAKTRRKLEDQRRMAFRRAIEQHNDERRLSQAIDDYPELIAINYVRALRAETRRQPGA
jgi:hypothetical protein